MNHIRIVRSLTLIVVILIGSSGCMTVQDTENSASEVNRGDVATDIFIDEAELPAAIELLARQSDINFIFGHDAMQQFVSADGSSIAIPMVGPLVWDQVTPRNALHAILDTHNLKLVKIGDTGVSKIVKK